MNQELRLYDGFAQCWKDRMPTESIFVTQDRPVDIEQLNKNIPVQSWELGLDNKPKPPWVLNHVVYLIDEHDGTTYTIINSTVGMARAYENLVSKVRMMRALRKARVTPVVTIGSAPMRTAFGTKMRPEFRIVVERSRCRDRRRHRAAAPS